MISGLGMSGGWRIGPNRIDEKHTHLQLSGFFNNKKIYLAYVDPRRFGRLYLVNKIGLENFLSNQGPDPTSNKFNLEYIYNTLKRYPERKIKPFLLDQKFFAGIGNYMSCEICALAKIRPTRKAKTLSKNDCQNILTATKLVIHDSIKNNGLTFSGGYTDANGEKGEGLKNLVVFYQKICGLCKKTSIKKTFLNQRGTYYCPSCQK